MNCKLCADIIISILLLLRMLLLTQISLLSFCVWKKMAEHSFMMLTLSSLLFLFFFVLEGDLSDRLSLESCPEAV